MEESPQRELRPIVFVVGAIGVVLLQIPMAYIGTEIGWGNGVETGIQTYKTGIVFGIGSGVLFSIFVLTKGLKWYRQKPIPAATTLMILAGILCVATVLFTVLRASASFFLYLEA